MSPASRKHAAGNARDRLREATARIIREEGYAAAPPRRVAAEAGVRLESEGVRWRSMRYADVGDESVAFTEEDVNALHRMLNRFGLRRPN